MSLIPLILAVVVVALLWVANDVGGLPRPFFTLIRVLLLVGLALFILNWAGGGGQFLVIRR